MPLGFGITNTTTVNMTNLTAVGNATNLPEFMINVNHIIFNGWLYFALLLAFWIILYLSSNSIKDQPINNLMYSGAFISILSFFIRAIFVVRDGIVYGLITDFQLWVFPVTTSLLAAIIWAIKDRN